MFLSFCQAGIIFVETEQAQRPLPVTGQDVLLLRAIIFVLPFFLAVLRRSGKVHRCVDTTEGVTRGEERLDVGGCQRDAGIVENAGVGCAVVCRINAVDEITVPEDVVARAHWRDADEGALEVQVGVVFARREELGVARDGTGKGREGVVIGAGVEERTQHDVGHGQLETGQQTKSALARARVGQGQPALQTTPGRARHAVFLGVEVALGVHTKIGCPGIPARPLALEYGRKVLPVRRVLPALDAAAV